MVLEKCNGTNLFVFTVMTCLVLILINVSVIQDTVDKLYKQFRKFLRTETFTDSAAAPVCTQIGSSCYACSNASYVFDPTSLLCYDPVSKNSYGSVIMNNNNNNTTAPQSTVLQTDLNPSNYHNASTTINSNNASQNVQYSYACANNKYTFDPITLLCYDPVSNNSYEPILSTVPYSSSLLPPVPVISPSTLSNYQCYDEDTLVGNMCYSCPRGGTYNASINMCEMIANSYLPVNSYVPPINTTTCNDGYTYDYGTCVQCSANDNYVSGHGCTKITGSPSTGSYPAINNPFNNDNTTSWY